MTQAMTKPAKTVKRDVSAAPADARAAAVALGEAEINALLNKAQRGDEQTWNELKPVLEKIPYWEQQYNGPASSARRLLLEATLGKNLVLREAWERRAKALEKELAGVDPSPLERILCERIASCWLDTHMADLTWANRLNQDNVPLAVGDYFQRRQERAHARYLGAILALARVRRLLAPMVAQVNIAQPGAQQLNIAAPAATSAALAPAEKAAMPGLTPE